VTDIDIANIDTCDPKI